MHFDEVIFSWGINANSPIPTRRAVRPPLARHISVIRDGARKMISRQHPLLTASGRPQKRRVSKVAQANVLVSLEDGVVCVVYCLINKADVLMKPLIK
jgi:hypothetical protein